MAIKNRYKANKPIGQKFAKVVDTYGYYYDKVTKAREFGKVGTQDIYTEIQSHDNETDMKFIKETLLNGNTPLGLQCEQGLYDLTGVSSDLLENFNKVQIAKDNFMMLPAELRAMYNGDFENFAKNFKKEDIDTYLKLKHPNLVQVQELKKQNEKEVKENGQE